MFILDASSDGVVSTTAPVYARSLLLALAGIAHSGSETAETTTWAISTTSANAGLRSTTRALLVRCGKLSIYSEDLSPSCICFAFISHHLLCYDILHTLLLHAHNYTTMWDNLDKSVGYGPRLVHAM